MRVRVPVSCLKQAAHPAQTQIPSSSGKNVNKVGSGGAVTSLGRERQELSLDFQS